VWAGDSLWGLVAGFGPLVMFLLVPVLGAIASRARWSFEPDEAEVH
jgi:hypothetical protein